MEFNEETRFESFDLDNSCGDYLYKIESNEGLVMEKSSLVIQQNEDKRKMQVVLSYKYPKFLKDKIGITSLDLNVKSDKYTGFYLFLLQSEIQSIINKKGLRYPKTILVQDIVHKIKDIISYDDEMLKTEIKQLN